MKEGLVTVSYKNCRGGTKRAVLEKRIDVTSARQEHVVPTE